MASEKKIISCKINGKMGGPKTPKGKAKSSMNAVKHYLSAKTPLVQTNWHTETQQELSMFQEKMLSGLNPNDEIQKIRANAIVDAAWRLHRFQRLEEAISSDIWTRLQLGENIEELTKISARISTIQSTVSTLESDIASVVDALKKDWGDPQHNDRLIDIINLHHIREFLEKSVMFDAYEEELFINPITESNEVIIDQLCNERFVTLKVITETFQEYLEEQLNHWSNLNHKSQMRYDQILHQRSQEVSQSIYIMSVASHPLLKGAEGQAYRLQRSMVKMLKDYNIQNN